jgi:hypothetical protein
MDRYAAFVGTGDVETNWSIDLIFKSFHAARRCMKMHEDA